MYQKLPDLLQLYSQDFDLIFQRDTDPIDYYCAQHSAQEQGDLLTEMNEVYQEVLRGEKSISDFVSMGLEYVPGEDRSPKSWLPRLIKHLEIRLSGSSEA